MLLMIALLALEAVTQSLSSLCFYLAGELVRANVCGRGKFTELIRSLGEMFCTVDRYTRQVSARMQRTSSNICSDANDSMRVNNDTFVTLLSLRTVQSKEA
jgi:hypothetical protein